MTKIGLIRCEKNEAQCPLTGCITCLRNATQGFAQEQSPELIGVATCHCPGENAVNLAKILKSKGAEAVYFCTCTFAHKVEGKWVHGQGFCDHVDEVLRKVSREAGVRCVKGTAHLPEGYTPETF